jgi:hypothetical protein
MLVRAGWFVRSTRAALIRALGLAPYVSGLGFAGLQPLAQTAKSYGPATSVSRQRLAGRQLPVGQ